MDPFGQRIMSFWEQVVWTLLTYVDDNLATKYTTRRVGSCLAMEMILKDVDTSHRGWKLRGYTEAGEVVMAKWNTGVEEGFGRTSKSGCMAVDGPGEDASKMLLEGLAKGDVRMVVDGADASDDTRVSIPRTLFDEIIRLRRSL